MTKSQLKLIKDSVFFDPLDNRL